MSMAWTRRTFLHLALAGLGTTNLGAVRTPSTVRTQKISVEAYTRSVVAAVKIRIFPFITAEGSFIEEIETEDENIYGPNLVFGVRDTRRNVKWMLGPSADRVMLTIPLETAMWAVLNQGKLQLITL